MTMTIFQQTTKSAPVKAYETFDNTWPYKARYSTAGGFAMHYFVDNSIISDTWLEAYRAPFPHSAYALGAIGWAKGYATGKHQFEMPSEEVKRLLSSKPALAIWGKQDHTLHGELFPYSARLFLTVWFTKLTRPDITVPKISQHWWDILSISSWKGRNDSVLILAPLVSSYSYVERSLNLNLFVYSFLELMRWFVHSSTIEDQQHVMNFFTFNFKQLRDVNHSIRFLVFIKNGY